MMSSCKPNILSFTIFLLLISTCVISVHPKQKVVKESFTLYMIHRDSPKSPLYDNTTTYFQRIHKALLRSKQRVKYLFHNNASTINNDLEPLVRGSGQGEYVMQYSLGNPMFTTYGVLDTGSSMVWLQCIPSRSWYDQGLLPYLNTDIFRDIVPICYSDQMCYGVVRQTATYYDYDEETCQCKYRMRYGDGGETAGHVFYTLLRLQTTFGDYMGFPRFIFGCSREVSETTHHNMASGIIGFGRAAGSLVSQIYDRIDGKFGYCLVSFQGPHLYSELKFGQSAVISGPDVVYTPMLAREPLQHYFISLQGIMVGSNWVPYLTGQIDNMMIDSGTIVTWLPTNFYLEFEAKVAAELDLFHERTEDPRNFFSLCYLQDSIDEMGGPRIAFHLSGGSIVLSPENIFARVVHGVVCLAFKGSDDLPAHSVAVFGAITQTNFMITHDLQRNQISFKRKNCAIGD